MKTHHRKMVETALMTSTLILTLLILSSFLIFDGKFDSEKKSKRLEFTQKLPQGDFKESFPKEETVLEINIVKNKRRGGCMYYGLTPSFLIILEGKISSPHDLWFVLKEEPYFSAFQKKITVNLKADRETPMDLIMDLKQELTKYNLTEIVYVQKNRSVSNEQYLKNIEKKYQYDYNINVVPPRIHYPEGPYDLFRK